MKTALAATYLALVSSQALAIERYTSTRMSCDRVRATIAADGAAIMRYTSTRTPGLQLYGRYVYDDRFCIAGEYADIVYIPAADTRSCPVLECKPVEDYDDFPFMFRRRH